MSKASSFAAVSNPPKIARKPVDIVQHGERRTDAYGWLRDEKWQDVLRDPGVLSREIREALENENVYYEAMTADIADLRDALFEEMRARIKEDDQSVPSKDGEWKYWVKYREGGEYPVYLRQRTDGGEAQIILDGDKEGEGEDFFDIGDVSHSPDHKFAACAIDRLGSEYYEITIRDIGTGARLPETIPHADGGGAVWTADSRAFYYVERDERQRPKRVKRHALGADPQSDAVIYEEPDDGFFLDIAKSQSGEYIFIRSGSHATSEVRFFRADDTAPTPTLIEPRAHNVEYSAEHHGDSFYILTNADGAVDFKVVKTPIAAPGKENWADFTPHRPGVYVIDFIAYKNHFIRLERRNALPQIVIMENKSNEYQIDFGEPAFSLAISAGYEFDTVNLRFTYSSPSTPRQTFDYNMETKERALLKTQTVPSGHDPLNYIVERIDVKAKDGAEIPVTILRLKTTPVNGSAPVLLYGYGAYGISIPDSFSTNILSLVNRGVIYALAHVRGGAEKGRQWYLHGKGAHKKNTFSDFIETAEALEKNGYADKGNIVIHGGSAGGLLVGAVLNMRPALFAGAIGEVPFVDVLNTVSDADLPLTPPEWDEWGNPIHSKEDFKRIAAYSPYDNIKDAQYPPIFATAGLADYRVTYWEPAKWIARLREKAKGGPFLLRTNMEAGHGGSAARFEQLKEYAHAYAFALKVMGKADAKPRPSLDAP